MRLALWGAVLIYAAGFTLNYSATPLGLYPVLDGREMLELARRIAAGDLPAEPFYRAPLYPAILSMLIDPDAAVRELPFLARLLNVALHLASAALVWRVAMQTWQDRGAATLACALFALNPVVLFFAVDPLDVTVAITTMLAGLTCALRGAKRPRRHATVWLALATLLFALAAMARPQLAALLVAWTGWLALASLRRCLSIRALGLALVPGVCVVMLMGAVNHHLGGEFRVLPWQGAYDLWSANKPGAHGRYFEQSTRTASYDTSANPARLEAEQLFRAQRPGLAPSPANQSRYWRSRLLDALASDPVGWLGRIAGKSWYLVNNFEQYNNKTYGFHKARSAWLRYNPVCWALVFALAAGGAAYGWRRAPLRIIGLLALAYAGALLASYVSARFRLPLVPLLAVAAGGMVPALAAQGSRLRSATAAALAFGLSIVPPSPEDATRTHVQDQLLLARANAELGYHDTAIAHAEAALAQMPDHPAALEIVCVAGFNGWLHAASREPASDACARAAPVSAPAQRLHAIQLWRAGRETLATGQLERLARAESPEREAALAALLMIGHLSPYGVRSATAITPDTAPVLLLAMSLNGDSAAADLLSERMPAAEIERQATSLRRVFSGR